MKENSIEFLTTKNIHPVKFSGKEAIYDCFFCGKKAHLYINTESGLYDCKLCPAEGDYKKLQKHFGDIEESKNQSKIEFILSKIQDNKKEKCIQYLKDKRFISQDCIEKRKDQFYYSSYQGKEKIVFPAFRDGSIVTFNYKSLNGSKPKSLFTKDLKKQGSHWPHIEKKYLKKKCILVESYINALTLYMYPCFTDEYTIIASHDSLNIPDILSKFNIIIVYVDNDGSSFDWAQKVKDKFPEKKVKRIVWEEGTPKKFDINDLAKKLQDYSKTEKALKDFQFIELEGREKSKAPIKIIEKYGRLYKNNYSKKDGKIDFNNPDEIQITSFTIQPIESIIIPGEGEDLKVTLKTPNKNFNVIFPADCWTSTTKFMKCLPGKETTFTGNINDVQNIRAYLAGMDMHHKTGIETAGFYKNIFLTEEGSLSRQGKTYDTVYHNNNLPTNCELISTEPATKDELTAIKKDIDKFNTPIVALPIIGWTTACFFKGPIMKILKNMGRGSSFPLLNAHGEAGAAKTRTARDVVMRIWNLTEEPKAIGQLSQFTLMKLVNGSNTIPLVLDENKAYMQNDKQKALISELIRSTYNALEGGRGKRDQSIQKYRYQSPVFILGETDFYSEEALLDRFIIVSLSKKDSAPCLENFLNLQKQPLEKLGRTILEKRLNIDNESIKKIFEEELQAVNPILTDRPKVNSAISKFGLRILGDILDLQFDLSKVDDAVKNGILEDGSLNKKSAVDKIIEAMCVMSEIKDTNQPALIAGEHYEISGGVLKLYTKKVYPVFRRWAKIYEFEGDLLPENTFKKQIKNEKYHEFSGAISISGKTKKGIVLNIDNMKKKGLEIFWDVD